MYTSARPTFAGLAATLALLLLARPATATDAAYCSSQNTADGDVHFHTYQSNGWCRDACSGYAYGVILDKNCWCSNYAPAEQEDTSECSDSCPGYPDDKCGNEAKGLYIYIELDAQPSGTKAATSQAASTSKASDATGSSSPSSTPASSEAVTSSQPTTLATSTSSSSKSSMTSIQVVTESGVQITKTIIVTPSSEPAQAENMDNGGASKSNTGAIVGGVVGGIVGLAAIIGAIFFFLWRRRRQQQDADEDGMSGVQRNVSTLSKAGLLRGEKSPQYPPPIATSLNSKRASRTLDTESISPVSGSDRRNSRPYVFDQRLNPSAIMTFDNGSRGSFISLEDSRDYGRTLNVRNPDPDP